MSALPSASKGRLRPSFFLLLGAACAVSAQQAVYRCGQEYTNTPSNVSRCERVAAQAITVIPGARVQNPVPAVGPVTPASADVSARPLLNASTVPSEGREDMARSILTAELEQARQRQARLLEEYRGGEPVRSAEEVQSPHAYQERVARLKAALERTRRDIDSLQRELARRPVVTARP